jgi:hypothetical protein
MFFCASGGARQMKNKQSNEYITLGTIAVVDISTPKHPDASMKIDLDVWLDLLDQGIGRVSVGMKYARVWFDGGPKNIHKMITPSFKDCVDHINHDQIDNRLSNLRPVTHTENCRNASMSKANKSGHSGIRERKGLRGSTWQAMIRRHDKQLHIGTFKSLAKAIAARKAAEVEFGFHPNHGAK